jgi:hypothetical protein
LDCLGLRLFNKYFSEKYPMRGKQKGIKEVSKPTKQGTEYALMQAYPGPSAEKAPEEKGKSLRKHAENREDGS